MPLLFIAAAAYAAGLLLGISLAAGAAGAAIALGMGALLLAAAGATSRSAVATAAGAVAAVGIVTGLEAERSRARCAARLLAAPAVLIAFDDRAREGDFARGRVVDRRCPVPAGIVLKAGRAEAGERALVAGRVVSAGRGVRVIDARIARIRPGSPAERWRASSGRAIDALFDGDAPLVRALLIADARGIPPAVRDRFASAGLVHILSISGLHVGIIAAVVALALRALRLSVSFQLAGTVALIGTYVALLGAPAPAVRAAIMVAVLGVSGLLQRPTSPWAALGAGAALPLLLDPHTVRDLGWQLSVAGMAALIAAGRLSRALSLPRQGWRGVLVQGLMTSLVASAVTAPLVAWYFGRVSLIAPLANLATAPIVAVLQPVLFLALVLAPIPAAASVVADASAPLLWAMDRVAFVAASVPHASIPVAPTLAVAALCGAGVALAVLASALRRPSRPIIGAALCIALIPWLPAPGGDGWVELHAIDVGQGDALALRTGRGRWILVDAGRAWRGGDAGRSAVVPYVRRRGGEVLAFVLSHPHADHAGGAATVMEALRPRRYFDGAYVLGSRPYAESLREARESGVSWSRARPGQVIRIDDVALHVLAPDSAWMSGVTDPNEASVVLLVEVGERRLLLTGDAEGEEEAWLLRRWGARLRADVLKVGHHGSRTSSSPAFLDAVSPSVALISVGAANGYGHPSPSVLGELARRGVRVYRTDRVGSVVVRTDGTVIEVQTDADR